MGSQHALRKVPERRDGTVTAPEVFDAKLYSLIDNGFCLDPAEKKLSYEVVYRVTHFLTTRGAEVRD